MRNLYSRVFAIAVFSAVISCASSLFAEIIHLITLKNGNTLTGVILEGTYPLVRIDVGHGIISIERGEIYDIKRLPDELQPKEMEKIRKDRDERRKITDTIKNKIPLPKTLILSPDNPPQQNDLKLTYSVEPPHTLGEIFTARYFSVKIIEKNKSEWKWGWNLKIENYENRPINIMIKIQFYDKDNFIIQEQEDYYNVYGGIDSKKSEIFVGSMTATPEVSKKVYRANAYIELLNAKEFEIIKRGKIGIGRY